MESDVEDVVQQKAKELFAVCDKEGKGFINKVDMQRLHGELPLSDRQLEEVFDSLDNDGNGFLTFDEFCDGFGGFLRQRSTEETTQDVVEESSDDFVDGDTYANDVTDDDSELPLRDLISRLVSNHSLDKGSEKVILDLCRRIQDEQDMQCSVEDFVQLVVQELSTAKSEKSAMERLLKERSASYEDEVKQLYQEMERQINEERDRSLNEEVQKERSLSLALREELKQKQLQLEAVNERHDDLEQQIANLSSGKDEVRSENSQLLQLNQSLMEELQTAQRDLEQTRVRMATLQKQKESQEETQQAEEEAHKLDLEKKSLIKQLEILKDVNRRLRDDKDEVLERSKHLHTPPSKHRSTSTPKHKAPLFTQGSNVGKYFQSEFNGHSFEQPPVIHEYDPDLKEHVNGRLDETVPDGKFELSSSTTQSDSSSSTTSGKGAAPPSGKRKSKRRRSAPPGGLKSNPDGGKEQTLGSEIQESLRSGSIPLGAKEESAKRARARFYKKLSRDPHAPASSSGEEDRRAGAEVNGNVVVDGKTDIHEGGDGVAANAEPDRVYKIVFVGNSGVGKTSFIQQFVRSTFTPNLAATIGVDYQVKTVSVEGQSIALQLWDTAGQERYRSITRQYFRKADGVVVVYDVTNEKSFLAVRNWMQSVQEGADPTSVILLLGNKSDIAESHKRQVTPKEGAKLAEEYGAKFSETSAKSGDNITSSMLLLAGDLTRLEDEQRESVLSLAASDEETKKGSCCGGRRNSV